MEPLMSGGEVAELLGVDVQTVKRWRDRGELPFVRLSTRKIMFKPEDVRGFVEGRRVVVERPVVRGRRSGGRVVRVV